MSVAALIPIMVAASMEGSRMEAETRRTVMELMAVAVREETEDGLFIKIPFDDWARIVANPLLQSSWKKVEDENSKG